MAAVLAGATALLLSPLLPAQHIARAEAARPEGLSTFYFYAYGQPGGQLPANRQPNCGKGVRVRKVAATYRAKRFHRGGFRTDIMYCGNSTYGYRHLKKHIGQYFGGWGAFDFSIAQVLKKPQVQFEQSNGTLFTEGPIIQCFPMQNFYILWSFFVIPNAKNGSIVTAFGRHRGRTNGPCPP